MNTISLQLIDYDYHLPNKPFNQQTTQRGPKDENHTITVIVYSPHKSANWLVLLESVYVTIFPWLKTNLIFQDCCLIRVVIDCYHVGEKTMILTIETFVKIQRRNGRELLPPY
jgi:hypothetical protein